MTEWSLGNLPPWFECVASVESAQGVLFADELPVVLATLRVSEDELDRWCKHGWVSFGPGRQTALEPHDVNEVRFVRDMVQSGLSDAHIATLFEQLPRPMNFSPDEVAYSFSLGWVRAGPAPEPDLNAIVDEHVDEWLDDLAANENESRLAELRDRIDQLLKTLDTGAEEPND